MANEERLSGPIVPQRPDRADEVQRRNEVAPPTPQPPSREAIREIDRSLPGTKGAVLEGDASAHAEALFSAADITRLRNQWTEIQSGFVDEPRSAVKRADSLVGEVLKSLSETFAKERARLESQWDHEGDVTTEDFRVTLRRYRTFFDRLLSI
jgi:hypothetical protein